MKKKLLLIPAFFLGILLTSCSKDDDTPAPSVNGYWEGKYSFGLNDPDNFYAFLFRNDGTVRIYIDEPDTTIAAFFEGTYTFQNGTVKLVIQEF